MVASHLVVPVISPLLSCTIFPLLPLFCSLLLAIREIFNSKAAARLVVAVGSTLDVLHRVPSIGVIVDRVNEGVCNTLVGRAKEPGGGTSVCMSMYAGQCSYMCNASVYV